MEKLVLSVEQGDEYSDYSTKTICFFYPSKEKAREDLEAAILEKIYVQKEEKIKEASIRKEMDKLQEKKARTAKEDLEKLYSDILSLHSSLPKRSDIFIFAEKEFYLNDFYIESYNTKKEEIKDFDLLTLEEWFLRKA